MRKTFLSIFLPMLVSTGTLFASNTQVDGIWYEFDRNTKTAAVTYRGSYLEEYPDEYSGSVVIPPTVTYNEVEYSVTSIGQSAFYECSSLTSVTIPNSVTSIGSFAFEECSSLTSITIPNSVTEIGYEAFGGCSSLPVIDNLRYADTYLVETIDNSLTSYQIKEGTKWIGDYAFYECSSLTSVTIPNSVTKIGYEAFYNCYSLTSITIPNSVESIGYYAFALCTSLTSIDVASDNPNYCSVDGVLFNKDKTELIQYPASNSRTEYTIPNSVTSIGDEAFSGCSLTSVTIPNSVTSIGDDAFEYCSSLISVTIPNSVTSIGSYAFAWCSSLLSVTIPNSVTSIGSYAFAWCGSLTSVTIPNSVTSIGKCTFYCCSSLTAVTIPNNVTSIGERAFSGCSSLTSVTIPNNVTSIGEYAFNMIPNVVYSGTASGSPWGARSMNGYVDGYLVYSDASKTTLLACSSSATGEITIPNCVTSIGNAAFHSCSSLTSVTIPNSVTSIGALAFSDCSSLTTMTIPNSVTSIGKWAFEYCHSLTSVTIGNSVTSIGKEAFHGCHLISVVWNAKYYPDLDDYSEIWENDLRSWIESFSFGCDVEHIPANLCREMNLTSITIPNSVTSIGNYAFSDCSQLTSLSLGENITTYGDYAFSGCTGLTSIYNYRAKPAKLGADAFKSVDYFNCTLYVLAGSVDMYKSTGSDWKDFYFVEPIGADEVVVEAVQVTPYSNTVVIAWPAADEADIYTLVIECNSVNYCVLTFNAQGQLLGIQFAPGRDGSLNATYATQTATGWQFTVTSLEAGTTYDYTVTAKKEGSETPVYVQSGSFTTTIVTAIDHVNSSSLQGGDRGRLIFEDNHIFILRGEKVYTIDGREVK